MATRFDALFAATAAPVLLDHHGESVTVEPGPGSGASPFMLTTVVNRDQSLGVSVHQDGEQEVRRATLVHPEADWPDPRRGDAVTLDGRTWKVERRTGQSGGMQAVEVVEISAAEKSAPGLRIKRT